MILSSLLSVTSVFGPSLSLHQIKDSAYLPSRSGEGGLLAPCSSQWGPMGVLLLSPECFPVTAISRHCFLHFFCWTLTSTLNSGGICFFMSSFFLFFLSFFFFFLPFSLLLSLFLPPFLPSLGIASHCMAGLNYLCSPGWLQTQSHPGSVSPASYLGTARCARLTIKGALARQCGARLCLCWD